jgi:hypothetical protein
LSAEGNSRIYFPRNDGRIDFLGLKINDEKGQQYVVDLFQYLWEKASPEMPEHMKKEWAPFVSF